jgi:NAD(P)-dependent dehydrogenase (short-subunit alcohol dehydrogenase family)
MPTVLITGANRGLGLEFVRQYLKDGATVIAACRDPAAAQPLAQLARDYHSALHLLEVDVADSASVERAAARAPHGAIDILINCAGVMGHTGQRLGSIDYDDWMHVLEVNVLGVARMSEAFLERVAKSERRLIVTITSGMGSIADNTSGGAIPYRTSKAAVNMLMRSAAVDLKSRGIACVVMNPGWVKTDMGGPNATRDVAEGADTAVWLALDAPATLTGKFVRDRKVIPW